MRLSLPQETFFMPDQIVHIGYPKTATTFLQWNIFPHLKNIHYVNYQTCREVFQQIIYSDPLDYSVELVKEKMIQREGSVLYSFESLAGSPFYYKGIGRSNIPFVLRSLGFNKVIITIREQTKAIDSYYRQYIVQGGTLSFRNWLDMADRKPIAQKYFQLGYLKYDKLIDKYNEIFGKENILILTQESLKDDSNEFIAKIQKFTNSKYEIHKERKANESLSNLSISVLRFFNHFLFSSVRPFHLFSERLTNRSLWKFFAVILDPYLLHFFSRKKSYVKKYRLEKNIQSVYAESNLRLKNNFGIDLREKH